MDDSRSDLRVTVVVPTYNRKESAEACLRSLIAQDLPAGEFEIILVDDGSVDGTAERLETVAGEVGPAVKVIRQARGGPSAARNTGADAARGEVLAFTDSDTVAHPSWLREALVAFDDPEVSGVEGRTVIPEGESGGLFARRTQNLLGRRFLGCNLFFRRRVFEAVGGFDERFGLIPFREDTDLAHRVLRAGHRIRFVPTAVIHHPAKEGNWKTPIALAWRYRNDPLLFRKDWKLYLARVDVHSLGHLALWKPRLVIYILYLVTLPILLGFGSPWAAGAFGSAFMLILLLHVHRCAPREASPREVLLLFPVCAAVPFVFFTALLIGALAGPVRGPVAPS